MAALAAPMRIGALRRLSYGMLAADPVKPALVDEWINASARYPGVRQDLQKFTSGLHKRHTLAAAERLRTLDRPVLLAWGRDDRFFTPAQAERLADTIPDARIEWIPGAKTFVSLDRPDRLAELIRGFAMS